MKITQTLKLNADSSPKPKVERGDAIRRIREQIEFGRAIKDTPMIGIMDLNNAQKRRTEWLENQIQLLTLLFNDPFLEEENSMDISFDIDNAITFGLKEKYFKDDINRRIGRLESFLERLKQDGGRDLMQDLMRQEQPKNIQPKELQSGVRPAAVKSSRGKPTRKEPPEEPPATAKSQQDEAPKEVSHRKRPPMEDLPTSMVLNQSPLPGANILLIHGQDGAGKESVLEFIEKLGLRALTPHEQTNGVKDLAEKFRDLANIRFAIVLFTPNDATTSENKPMGRRGPPIQDIIFEFGYVVGKLGHERVCVLCPEGAEIPMEHSGAVTIPMDARGGWRLLVAKEIKQAGIEIDLNKAI